LVILRPEPPVRIPQRKAAVSGEHAEFLVVEDLEDRLEEVETIAPGNGLHFILNRLDLRRQRSMRRDGHRHPPPGSTHPSAVPYAGIVRRNSPRPTGEVARGIER